MDNKKKEALAMIKAVYKDGKAEINGGEYSFLGTTHTSRRKIFAFYSSIQHQLEASNFIFLDSPEFQPVEKLISDMVTYNGDLLSKTKDHWENHPEDYIQFTVCAMGVISYPFLRGSHTG